MNRYPSATLRLSAGNFRGEKMGQAYMKSANMEGRSLSFCGHRLEYRNTSLSARPSPRPAPSLNVAYLSVTSSPFINTSLSQKQRKLGLQQNEILNNTNYINAVHHTLRGTAAPCASNVNRVVSWLIPALKFPYKTEKKKRYLIKFFKNIRPSPADL